MNSLDKQIQEDLDQASRNLRKMDKRCSAYIGRNSNGGLNFCDESGATRDSDGNWLCSEHSSKINY